MLCFEGQTDTEEERFMLERTGLLALVFGFCFLSIAVSAQAGEIHEATSAGDIDRVRALLDAGTNVDEKRLATPLYYASRDGKFEIAELLVKRGADVNAKSRFGAPLHIASRKGHQKIVKLLLENGANPDDCNNNK